MPFGVKVIDGIGQKNDQSFKLIKGRDIHFAQDSSAASSVGDTDIFLLDVAAGGTQLSTTYVTAANLKSYINNGMSPDTGSSNIITLGTITTGVWNATAIEGTYIATDAIDGSKIADDSIDSEHYVNGSIDTYHIGDDQITYAKIQNVTATDRVLGRDSTGAGVIEEITPTNLRTMINVADGAEVNVQSDWDAASGDAHILNKPTIPVDLTSANTGTVDASNYTNSTYSISVVSGANSDQEIIRLSEDNGSGVNDDIVLEAGTGLSISKTGDIITLTNDVSDTNTQNTTTLSFETSSNDVILRNTIGGASPSTDDITIKAGDNITLTRDDENNMTIDAATAIGGATDINGLSDVNTSGVAANDILVWDGQDFQVLSMADMIANPAYYTFSWDKVVYTNTRDSITDTSPDSNQAWARLIGDGNHQTNISVTHTLNASVEGLFTSGGAGGINEGIRTRTLNGSWVDHGSLSYNSGNPTASHTINLPYPTDLSGASEYNFIGSKFQYDGNNYDHYMWYQYKNYMYLGKHTDDTPSDADLHGTKFPKEQLIDSGTTSNDVISAYGVSLNGTSQHLQFWYPDRITSTPSFEVGSSAASISGENWIPITGTIEHENERGFSETYKGYKSPNPLNNSTGTNIWYVKVTMS